MRIFNKKTDQVYYHSGDIGLLARIKMPGLKEEEISVIVDKEYNLSMEIRVSKRLSVKNTGRGCRESTFSPSKLYMRVLNHPREGYNIGTSYKNGILTIFEVPRKTN